MTGTDGEPVPGARIEVWEADADGLYDVQYGDDRVTGRGHLHTDDDGRYRFWAVTPTPYPIPYDGPVGRMLDLTGRHPWRPAHVHMIIRADGYRTLTTHVFDVESPYLDSDAVFAVKPSLTRAFVVHGPDDPDTPEGVRTEWVSVQNDLVLAPTS